MNFKYKTNETQVKKIRHCMQLDMWTRIVKLTCRGVKWYTRIATLLAALTLYSACMYRSTVASLILAVHMVQCKDLRGNPKPRVSPDRTWPDRHRSGIGEHFKEYFRVGSGRGILFRVGPGRGIFYRGIWDIFSRDFRDKLAFHSQTEEVEWLLSLISTFTVKTVFRD